MPSLPFVSKIVEKVAAKRPVQHLRDNGLHEELQSAHIPTVHQWECNTISHVTWHTPRLSCWFIWIYLPRLTPSMLLSYQRLCIATWEYSCMEQFIHLASDPACLDWDGCFWRTACKMRCSTGIGVGSVVIYCVYSMTARNSNKALCGLSEVCRWSSNIYIMSSSRTGWLGVLCYEERWLHWWSQVLDS